MSWVMNTCGQKVHLYYRTIYNTLDTALLPLTHAHTHTHGTGNQP